MAITGEFQHFEYFNFETSFVKKENLFEKLEHRFLFESTTIERTSFPYKTALSKANVKTNRMRSREWTSQKEGNLLLTIFFFKIKFK